MVWRLEQQYKCPTCGTFDWEWEDGAQPWVAAPRTCLACADTDRVVGKLRASKQSLNGMSVRLYANGN